MNYGYARVAAGVPETKVADCKGNINKMLSLLKEADLKEVQIIVFPELSITSYTCGDLFFQQALLDKAQEALGIFLRESVEINCIAILGMPIYCDNQLFNCAVIVKNGNILGVVPKTYIPGYNEFYEERWFSSSKNLKSNNINLCKQEVPIGIDLIFKDNEMSNFSFGVEICEDLWAPIPPSSYLAMAGAYMLFNLSASNELIGKSKYRQKLISAHSGRTITSYVFCSSGVGESSTDLVFGGHVMIAEAGNIIKENERFEREPKIYISEIDLLKLSKDRMTNTCFMEGLDDRKFRDIKINVKKIKIDSISREIDPHPFVPSNDQERDERCDEIFNIQTNGLAKRLLHTGIKKVVIGVSGGLDSTLALLVCVKTMDKLNIPRKNIIAITMPGFGTTGLTYNNSIDLINAVGANLREIDIKKACNLHFDDIGHDKKNHDIAYENVQARERTQILMDIANLESSLVIGTGDLSELALGWSTYNGDHMSMYSVNCGIPKTLVKYLVKWVADNVVKEKSKNVLASIIATPISPELIPTKNGEISQKTEEIIGPYELHDFFLYHMIRYGATPERIIFLAKQAFEGVYTKDIIVKWLKVFVNRFFSQQFKRSCLPDGPKVGTIALSPRGDWRMPSDAFNGVWVEYFDE